MPTSACVGLRFWKMSESVIRVNSLNITWKVRI